MVRYHEWNIHCQTLILHLMEASEHIYDKIFTNDEHKYKQRKEHYQKSIAYSTEKVRAFQHKATALQHDLRIDLHPALRQMLTIQKDNSKDTV